MGAATSLDLLKFRFRRRSKLHCKADYFLALAAMLPCALVASSDKLMDKLNLKHMHLNRTGRHRKYQSSEKSDNSFDVCQMFPVSGNSRVRENGKRCHQICLRVYWESLGKYVSEVAISERGVSLW